MSLTAKDLLKLQGIHDDLKRVLLATKSPIQFEITQGLRTADEEMKLWLSCHNNDGTRNDQPWKTNANGYPVGITSPNGIGGTGISRHQGGLAIDFCAIVNGDPSWDLDMCHQIANAILKSGAILNIPVIYGGSWLKPDSDHIELNHDFYKGV